jgi:hypothetical protein
MDTAILEDELSSNAIKLIEVLDEKGFVFTVAALNKNEDGDDWRLVLGIPGIRTRGSRKPLTEINDIIDENDLKISLYDIILIDDQDRLFNLLRLKFKTGKDIAHIRFRGNYIEGVRIPDSIIYRVN